MLTVKEAEKLAHEIVTSVRNLSNLEDEVIAEVVLGKISELVEIIDLPENYFYRHNCDFHQVVS